MRKLLFLGLLPACVLAVQPVDLLPRGSYCQPVTPDEYVCHQDFGPTYKCINRYGRWSCWRAE